MNFALIPWGENEKNDKIFYENTKDGKQVPTKSAAYLMMKEFERLGHTIHTIDLYPQLEDVNFFLFYVLDWNWVKKLADKGLEGRMVYCNAEPPSVTKLNTPEGFELLKKYFPYILTWNPEWVDGKRIFHRVIPYFYDFRPCKVPFSERKMITAISANKKSDWEGELYTEREKSYYYFEKNYPEEFDFYGVGWEGTNHPCYKGTVKDKKEVFHQYKFAICFENTRTKKNYITEKIWDCLDAQIVPIYAGAEQITDFIPQECFIDFYSFKNYDELSDYLFKMSEEKYNEYLKAAKRLLADEKVISLFRGERYAKDIIDAVSHPVVFSMKLKDKVYISLYLKWTRFVTRVKKYIKSIIKLK